MKVAEAAKTLGDSDEALRILAKSVDAVNVMRKRESGERGKEKTPGVFWQATTDYRDLMHGAGRVMGPRGEALLEIAVDRELRALGPVEFTAGLLGMPRPEPFDK